MSAGAAALDNAGRIKGTQLAVDLADVYTARPGAAGRADGTRFYALDKAMTWIASGGAWVLAQVYAPEVTSLPTAPIDQQECVFVADATAGLKWHLRYRAASASAYKWEVVGQPPPLAAEVATVENTSSTTYADLATVGPQVVLPLAGDYDIDYFFEASQNTANNITIVAPKLGAAATADGDAAVHQHPTITTSTTNGKGPIRRLALAVAATIKLQYRTNANTSTISRRGLAVRPVRVG